jgi:hypothetical protein
MSKDTVKIDPVVLAKQVEEGMKKDALAAHYGLNISQMGTALKKLGLKIRKFHAPAFEFVTETKEEVAEIENPVLDFISENTVPTEEVAEVETEEVAEVIPENNIWKD